MSSGGETRVTIPDALRGDIVQHIHSSHLGIEGMSKKGRRMCVLAGDE